MKPNHPPSPAIKPSTVMEWPAWASTGSHVAHPGEGDIMCEHAELKFSHVLLAAVFILIAVIVNVLPY